MGLVDHWKSTDRPTLSFEFFPARNEKAAANQQRAIGNLVALEPDFVSVTFGAGGSTIEGSRQLVEHLLDERGLEVLPYFACFGLSPETVTEVLRGYEALGVRNLLAVRGDVPRDRPDFAPHPHSLPHASDLLAFVRERFGFCLGAAGYPEGHIEAASLDEDLRYLELKVDMGAEFIITNYCYHHRYFLEFLDKVRARGIDVPVIAGVMPIFNVKMNKNLARLCGATLPDDLLAALDGLPEGDPKAVLDLGVRVATDHCAEILAAGVQGVHFYTMNRGKAPVRIVRNLRERGLL
jgi:methylenetetrahydrofolate reductase (NADPH)